MMGILTGPYVMAWHTAAAAADTVSSDQHTQTLVAIGVLAVTVLGGLAHTVYRLGRLTEQVAGLRVDVNRVEGIAGRALNAALRAGGGSHTHG